MFIVASILAQPDCRNFLPEQCNTLIKQQLRGGNCHRCCLYFKLMFFRRTRLYHSTSNYAHQTSQKNLYQVLWYNIPINLKQLHYHTATESLHYLRGAKFSWTPTLEGVYLNLALSVFSFACNARSPNHQLFLFFPHKNASQFLKRRSDWLALEGLESPKVTFLGFWQKSYLFRYAFLFQ